ncbi:hypothetical protein MSKOL_0585 [Methanosarcina sp. Kolksee]|nr:hypothetical protein MSKOL_0585 [Methanosarcina sp. Kolksee]
MLSNFGVLLPETVDGSVSILVLVDLALECFSKENFFHFLGVSILVLVDLALEYNYFKSYQFIAGVSILVLVDLALESFCLIFLVFAQI